MKQKEFNLLGTKYTILYTDKIDTEEEGIFRWGGANAAARKITLARLDYDGNPINKDDAKITLLHELIHVILDEGQYSGSSRDEPMVEWLARCLKSLLDLRIIK